MVLDDTVFSIDSHAREVAHMLVGARQLVEECGLSAVLLSRERKGQGSAFRQRILVRFIMIDTLFTESRVGVMVG